MRNLSSMLVLATTLVAAGACRTSPAAAGAAGASGGAMAMAMPAEVTAANIALGDSLFNNGSCQRCHGKGGVGGARGPVLNDGEWLHVSGGAFDGIVALIKSGVPKAALKDTTRFPMNPRGGPMRLTDPQVNAVAAYVYSLTHK